MSDPDADVALRRAVRLDRYAEILAAVVHFGTDRTEEVVARFGLSLDRWRAVDQAWRDELALGMKRQQRETALRFSSTFHAARQRLAQRQPLLATIGDAAAEAPVTAPAPEPPKRRVELPSFMLAQAAPAPPPAPPPPPVASPARPLDATTTWGAMPLPAAAAPLPFVEGAPADSALHAAVEHAGAVQGPNLAKPVALGATMPLGQVLVGPTLPFGGTPAGSPPGTSSPRVPELTLEQRASLDVDLKAQPERKPQILQRYGLTPEQYERVSAAWEARLAQDPKLRADWNNAVTQYRVWLAGNPRR